MQTARLSTIWALVDKADPTRHGYRALLSGSDVAFSSAACVTQRRASEGIQIMNTNPSLPGTIVGQRYLVARQICRGGMGVISEARPMDGGPPVALKLIAPELMHHPLAIARFLREANALSRLRSPHVVKILDQGMDAASGPFIVMELLEGEDLAARIVRRGPLALSDALEVFEQVAEALVEAHDADLVHRDLKPANIFLARDVQGNETAKLLDFGTVKSDTPLTFDGNRTAQGVVVGTISRMSPEQLKGEAIDSTADVWGMALCVFEALTGVPAVDPDLPFGQLVLQICHTSLPLPSQFNPSLPSSLDAWFEKATARSAAERYATVRELLEALAEACVRVSGVVRKPNDVPMSEALPVLNHLGSEPMQALLSLPPLVARSVGRGIPSCVRVAEGHDEQPRARSTLVPGGARHGTARTAGRDNPSAERPSAPTLVPAPVMGGRDSDPWARTA